MTDAKDTFSHLAVRPTIDLRWTLPDIVAKRWKLFPIDQTHLKILIEMRLVEMRDDQPVPTNSGLKAIS